MCPCAPVCVQRVVLVCALGGRGAKDLEAKWDSSGVDFFYYFDFLGFSKSRFVWDGVLLFLHKPRQCLSRLGCFHPRTRGELALEPA